VKREPARSSYRTIRRFLALPRCIGGEWRWLEVATIVQIYRISPASNMAVRLRYAGRWESVQWETDGAVGDVA
jgi:hypothetical protein